jgi:regulator of extracellular matrix RemA (YlzA/DUF370 family)
VYLGVSSPVVGLFLSSDVPRDVRLLASRGLVTAEGRDRLVLLALLTTDPDAEVASCASATIAAIPTTALQRFLARDDVPAELRAWYAPYVATIEEVAVDQETPVERRLAPRDGPMDPGDAGAVDADPAVIEAIDAVDSDEDAAIHRLLTSLPVPDKIKIATLGRREQRSILVRDPNRIVCTAVLASPKLTDTEVENFARMQNVSEEVLRIIGTSRAWTKKYSVIANLVKNPRTPTGVSLPLMLRLVERDLKALSVDRNVPESVRLGARKQLAVLQARKS